MNQIIILTAGYLIYISVLYAAFYVFWKRDRKHFIKDTIFLLGAATISWILAHVIKDYIAHPRPDAALALLIPDDPYSFPSGHASFMFALGFTMNYFNWRAGFFIVVLALLTGIARVLGGVHFWYDIVGGAILGYIVSLIAIFLYKKFLLKK